MEKTIIVKGVEQITTGTGQRGAWILSKIKDSEGVEYKTFETLNLNTPYRIFYTEEARKPFVNKEGKTITPKGVDRFIKKCEISETPPVSTGSGTGQHPHDLNACNSRLDALELRIKVLEDANHPDF